MAFGQYGLDRYRHSPRLLQRKQLEVSAQSAVNCPSLHMPYPEYTVAICPTSVQAAHCAVHTSIEQTSHLCSLQAPTCVHHLVRSTA